MWINLIRADQPSINGNIYPESVLRGAVTEPPRPIYNQYGAASPEGFVHHQPEVGRALAYRFMDGWFQAEVDTIVPEGKVLRAAVVGTLIPKEEGTLIVGIDRIDHIALCSQEVASWCIDKG